MFCVLTPQKNRLIALRPPYPWDEKTEIKFSPIILILFLFYLLILVGISTPATSRTPDFSFSFLHPFRISKQWYSRGGRGDSARHFIIVMKLFFLFLFYHCPVYSLLSGYCIPEDKELTEVSVRSLPPYTSSPLHLNVNSNLRLYKVHR